MHTTSSEAAVAALELQADSGTHTWNLYALLTNDNRGLASFAVDVTGAGGLSITGSSLQAPRPFSATVDDFVGFKLFRNAPANGIDIRASQDTVSGNANLLILDAGIGTHVHLASGTFSGEFGSLTASLHAGSFFNAFPTGFVAGGSTVAVTSVTPSTVSVPEPATACIGAIVAVGLLARRRRRGALTQSPSRTRTS